MSKILGTGLLLVEYLFHFDIPVATFKLKYRKSLFGTTALGTLSCTSYTHDRCVNDTFL